MTTPQIDWEKVLKTANDIMKVLVENECTINEAGLAFTQATIGQTKIAIEEGRL